MKVLDRFKGQGYRERLRSDFRSARDIGITAPLRFRKVRASASYQAAYDKPDPLVSICIATYNCAQLLLERAVASSLAQTHQNIEVLVVGDCCTDETAELMATVRDPRLTFVNLAERGNYPTDPELRWMVAGYAPFVKLMDMARGDFLTHLDHDDEHAPDRVEQLLNFIRKTRADLVYHPFRWEQPDGDWLVNEAEHFRWSAVTTSSVFYHGWLRNIGADPLCYRYGEPGDWNRFRKIRYIGAKTVRYPEVLLTHYKERTMRHREAAEANGDLGQRAAPPA